ncbi:ABC transporter, ATP-binding protein [Synechococcus sp. PCC 7335]|uniref:ATP-binding cassette domain-containing protein n=1 Tax=Synechococcus sp. (strain ATCC 29403 / PCC 7335) TaxID=91464 RepID=UPI00017EB111|nr:ABC transporter ATP-binding protein [Synechococcus sp. PCC 7335]EDX84186.1 ABC transporter, ATP-binding protein [Synechococcus sp. PCC 7335]
MASISIWQVLGRLIRYAPKLYCTDTLLWLCIAGLPIVPGVIIREFFNSLTQPSSQTQLLPFAASPWLWIALLLAVGLARVIAIFTGRITKTQHRFLMSALIRHNLLLELFKRPGAELAARQQISPGEILNYFRDDAQQIEDTVASVNEVFAEAVFAIASISLLLSVNARITAFVFVPLCVIALLVHKAEHRLKRYRRASRQATAQVTGLITETFSALQAIKVAGAEADILRELKKKGDRRQKLTIRDRIFTTSLDAGFEGIVSLGTALLLLLAAQSSQSTSAQNSLSVGDFALFVYYLSFITFFLAFFGSFIAVTKHSEVSFERMAALIEESTLKKKKTSPVRALVHPYPLYLKPLFKQPPLLPPLEQTAPANALIELRVENLTYRYPNSVNGIEDISFSIKRGSLTVITGDVGSGKTTLLRALLGLLSAQRGRLFWNGQKILDPASFFVPPQAAYTPQIPHLFSASVQENIQIGWKEPNMAMAIDSAIATAALDRDISTMPNGLDTPVGTQGFQLSGGQKQRVAAARMILRKPQLLVFDDLSSALDIKTEEQLWNHFLRPSSNNQSFTCLAVSHRQSVLDFANQIIVMKAGRLDRSRSHLI